MTTMRTRSRASAGKLEMKTPAMKYCVCLLGLAMFAKAQPSTVILVSGFSDDGQCQSGAGVFGALIPLLQHSGFHRVSGFDSCIHPNAPIEVLAAEFGKFIDSFPGPVDVVAYSMGGLIVRSYLSFTLPQVHASYPNYPTDKIRKLILIGTPNFGSGMAILGNQNNNQVKEMLTGSLLAFYEVDGLTVKRGKLTRVGNTSATPQLQ